MKLKPLFKIKKKLNIVKSDGFGFDPILSPYHNPPEILTEEDIENAKK